MTIPADAAQPSPSLRVRIVARDPMRHLGLRTIVAQAGHRVTADSGDSDVVLADGDNEIMDELPVLALGADEAGQAGRLPREATPAQIDAALRAVAAGLIVRAEELPSRAFGPAAEGAGPLLTPREIELLALIGDGLSNKEVARRLGISGHTVKFHIESLFRKLAAGSRAEAVHKGLRKGLIEL
jgi:two-component system, NarL family, nitrate/nitrite response regulator NarL